MKKESKQIKQPITHKYNALFRVLAVVGIIIILMVVTTVLVNPKVRGTPRVCFKHDNCLELVGVMDTDALRAMGLQNRPPLKENEGMIFIFPEERPVTFWMKDVSFPIDMIFLDKSKRVVKIEKDVPPCTSDPCPLYPCNYMTKYVVETPAGYADSVNLYLRDEVNFENTMY